jgi:hypothetical protein
VSDALSICLAAWFGLLTCLYIAQTAFVIRHLRRGRTPPLDDAECPPALVVLCLRGGDPFLVRSLGRLIDQDYPRYRVRIVVDSPRDEAHQSLADVWGSTPPEHVEVLTLTERFDTCTFKMSGILRGTQQLPEGTAFVALMDGDTVPHSTWLRELAAPIVRRGAAVTTGNRWYFPDRPTLGSMCRFWWNAAAVPQMALYHMPWGGTMAIRHDVITDQRLRDRIRHACSEDTSTGQYTAELRLPVYFEPTLLIVNREEIGLRSFFDFETRQLLFTRLEFWGYWPMALFGLLSLTMVAYPPARLLGLAVPWWVDAAFVAYFLVSWAGVVALGMNVRQVLSGRHEQLGGWEGRRWLWATLSVFLMPLLHLAAVLRAVLMRQVKWRGVWYRVGGRPRVQVLRDEWP